MKRNNDTTPPATKGWRKLLDILIGLALLEGLFFLFRLGATWFSPPPT